MNNLPKHHFIPVRDETQTNYIRVDEGEFEGVTFRFGGVKFVETPRGLQVDYTYEVREPGEKHTVISLESNQAFRELLNGFMDKSLKEYHSFLKENKESGE